ncbi:MAG: hypothetical protein WAS72_05845 [Saprospiraceae bacterium]
MYIRPINPYSRFKEQIGLPNPTPDSTNAIILPACDPCKTNEVCQDTLVIDAKDVMEAVINGVTYTSPTPLNSATSIQSWLHELFAKLEIPEVFVKVEAINGMLYIQHIGTQTLNSVNGIAAKRNCCIVEYRQYALCIDGSGELSFATHNATIGGTPVTVDATYTAGDSAANTAILVGLYSAINDTELNMNGGGLVIKIDDLQGKYCINFWQAATLPIPDFKGVPFVVCGSMHGYGACPV